MRKVLLVYFLTLMLAAGVFQAASFSQEGTGYTYGTVVGVSPDRITLNEYSADTGRNEDVPEVGG